MFAGDLQQAVARFEEGLAALPATAAHGSQRALLLISLAVAGGLAGDEERVIARQWELAALTEVGGEFVRRIYSARWLWALGLGAWRRGDLDRAAELQQESLRLRADLNDRMDNAHCVEALAWIAASAHHYERAAVLLGAAASRWQSMGMTLDGYQQPGHLGCLHAAPRRQRTGRADYSTAVRASSPLCDDGSSTRREARRQKSSLPCDDGSSTRAGGSQIETQGSAVQLAAGPANRPKGGR